MEVTITNVFDNDALKEPKKFKKGHGNAFLIEMEDKKMLFDTGDNGKKLLDNLALLGISPAEIDMVILSHGHFDHVTGLVSLVEARPASSILDITAHPTVLERKGSGKPSGDPASIADIGFPALDASFKDKTRFTFLTAFSEIRPGFFFLGEIPDRPEQDGTATMVHEVNGRWVEDPLLDDTSLVFTSVDGLVVLAGCCHAGLLNTLRKVRQELGQQAIVKIVGGTHMMAFTPDEIRHVADVLERDYGSPGLCLNHCTGARAIEMLRERFGNKVQPFPAGATMSFVLS